jgi:hypothetical protein
VPISPAASSSVAKQDVGWSDMPERPFSSESTKVRKPSCEPFFQEIPRDALFLLQLAIEGHGTGLDFILREVARQFLEFPLLVGQPDVEHDYPLILKVFITCMSVTDLEAPRKQRISSVD